jgi:hypothetical protein
MNAQAVHDKSFSGLLPLLGRLDERLIAAVSAAEKLFAARAAGDLYRGLAITPADVDAALHRTPGRPFESTTASIYKVAEATHSSSLRHLLWLQRVYELTDLDLDVMLLGLAPEVDLRYERLYAYLQDDVSRRRPSVDLALNLLCSSPGEKLQQRARFSPDAPLVRHRLIELIADPGHPPLLALSFRLDEQIVRFLLLDDSMDSRLIGSCRIEDSTQCRNDQLLSEEMIERLRALVVEQSPLRVRFEGAPDSGQAEAVALLADALNLRALHADLSALGASTLPPAVVLHSLAREARLRGALLHLTGFCAEAEPSAVCQSTLWLALETVSVPYVIETAGSRVAEAAKAPCVATLNFSAPAAAQREHCWRLSLRDRGLEECAAPLLAERYRLNYSQIRRAAASALEPGAVTVAALSLSARAQTRFALTNLAPLLNCARTWEDLVLPADAIAQLREVCAQFEGRRKVFEVWGFGGKLPYGKGTSVLFAGSPGTGKTMAAEVVANELGLDLCRIDLASVVSKYIGETEKNLEKIFAAAARANAILLFDEADALFGKRSEVKDAHDRYANLEVSYLLQRMEQYEGVTILATNLRDNLDDAFLRRIAFVVHFPFPDEQHRGRIWAGMWPVSIPLAEDVDLAALARSMKLSGGSIKNVGLAAAFLAAADGGVITVQHLLHAARREYQKLGKSTSAVDVLGRTGAASPGRLEE